MAHIIQQIDGFRFEGYEQQLWIKMSWSADAVAESAYGQSSIMCTATWWNQKDSYGLFFSRDELKTRQKGVAPERVKFTA